MISVLVAFVVAAIVGLTYMQQWQQQQVRVVNGTIERGIMMQMTADEFERLMGRHPLYD